MGHGYGLNVDRARWPGFVDDGRFHHLWKVGRHDNWLVRQPCVRLARLGDSRWRRECHALNMPAAESELPAFNSERRKVSMEGYSEKIASSMTNEYVQTDIYGYQSRQILLGTL